MLQQMVRDRETQIHLIRRKMEEQTKKMTRLKEQLIETRKVVSKETVERQIELEDCQSQLGKLQQQYKEVQEALDMKKQQTALHTYQEVMKSVATPESRDSSYVLRMQAQLCKAMHSMGMVENQLALASKQADSLQKFFKESITRTVEEKSQVELKLMNDLVMEDNSRRELEQKTKL